MRDTVVQFLTITNIMYVGHIYLKRPLDGAAVKGRKGETRLIMGGAMPREDGEDETDQIVESLLKKLPLDSPPLGTKPMTNLSIAV